MRLLVVMVLALVYSSGAAAQVKSVEISTSRPFGHFVGDVLHSEVDVAVDPAYTLVDASVPQTGALDQSTEIVRSQVKVESRNGARVYRILVDYQTFYPALDSRQIAIPAFELSFVSGDHRAIAKVPEWSFLISPLREVLPATRESGQAYMMPDAPPGPFEPGRLNLTFLASFAAFLLMLTLLVHRLAWWPFLAPKRRPFVRAARQVHRLLDGAAKTTQPDSAPYRESLQIVHRAIDETVGRAVLGDDISAFLRDAPAFSRLRDDFTSFFRSSRRVFFADTSATSATFGARELCRFCDQLAATERVAR